MTREETYTLEPCEDCIYFPKGTLKKRGKGYVIYNYEWLKSNWQTELKIKGIEVIPLSVIEDIKAEIEAEKQDCTAQWHDPWWNGRKDGLSEAIDIIDKHISGKEKE